MPHISFDVRDRADNSELAEKLTVNLNGIKGMFKSFTGQSGEYWVSIIPSLNVSGYGNTEQEAIDDLKENTDQFWQDLFSLTVDLRHAELRKLGWTVDKIFKKKFSKTYVDDSGVLQNFDYPELVKRNVFQAA